MSYTNWAITTLRRRPWRHTQARLRDFVDDEVRVSCERLAVTLEQIEDMSLPTRPTKRPTAAQVASPGSRWRSTPSPRRHCAPSCETPSRRCVHHVQLAVLRLAEDSERRCYAGSPREYREASDDKGS